MKSFLGLVLLLSLSSVMFGQTKPVNPASLAQQRMCAEQAKVYARDQHASLTDRQYADLLETLTSHFDPALNVCYVRTVQYMDSSDSMIRLDTVSDAFEGTIYAAYSWNGWINPDETNGQSNHSALGSCYVRTPKRGKVSCGSTDSFGDSLGRASDMEFNLLVEKYLGLRMQD